MEFPYGKAPLAILILALLAGGAVLWRDYGGKVEGIERPDIVFTIFSKEHALAYRPAIKDFEKANNVHIQLQVVNQQALQGRLQSALQVGADVPDMVELIDGSMGVFTKGPVADVGFVDLTDKIKSTGLYDRVVRSRFSKWSTRGHIFGLPHDVHPMLLCYRKDVVAGLGIDVTRLTTWDKFTAAGRKLVKENTDPNSHIVSHYMIDLPAGGEDPLQALMLQHGGGMFDDAGNVIFDSEATVDVFCWYVKQIVDGPDRIAFPCGWGQNLAKALTDGLVLFIVCPDWRTGQFEMDVPGLSGKLALMPLPAWEEGGLRTSTWGGTGLCITKQCKNFDLAWKLAMYLYYSPDQLGPRFKLTNILPPLKEAWNQPQFHEINPFWSVSLGETYIPWATQVPNTPSDAYQYTANGKLYNAFSNVSQYYAKNGENGLRDFARQELKRRADEIRREMARNMFYKRGDAPVAQSVSPPAPPSGAQ